MLRDTTIAVLIPAFNEETQIEGVLRSLPVWVDHIVVVDDASTDQTAKVVQECAHDDRRIHLIRHEKNQGVGAAIATAYLWARDHRVGCAVSIDADGQMDPAEMISLVSPIVDGLADYTKGNRLLSPTEWARIPRIRLLGNAILSLMTKIASGYWSVADSQSGYTAVSRYGLENIDWEHVYRGYGRPNDILVKANVAGCRVADVPIKPIYGVGERSTMKVPKVVFTISFMLWRRFWWRLFHKYVLRDFHPLVFFYLLAAVTFVLDIGLIVRMIVSKIADGRFPPITTLSVAFLTITTLNALFFAFWMDMEVNKSLAVRLPSYFRLRSKATEVEPQPEATETTAARSQQEAPFGQAVADPPQSNG